MVFIGPTSVGVGLKTGAAGDPVKVVIDISLLVTLTGAGQTALEVISTVIFEPAGSALALKEALV